MALCLPFVGVALFFLQKFYLRTSRQMRLLDLEAKSPLYTHLTATLEGVRTIRAFKWNEYVLTLNFGLLDLAQRPFYLLLCLQNWLNLVLDVIVACLAVILITLAVTLRHSMNSSLLGVAMVSIVNFSQMLSSFVSYWTSMETSLGAISRTRHFITQTPAEFSNGAAVIPAEWPSGTSIKFEDVSASYQYVIATFSTPKQLNISLTNTQELPVLSSYRRLGSLSMLVSGLLSVAVPARASLLL
jgi:ATP-binding cassette subfamily C (CFTR/MRP) protein 1